MTQLAFQTPTLGQPNNTEDPDIVNGLNAIKGIVNGQLDTDNLSPTANIKLTQLAAEVVEQIQAVVMPTGSLVMWGGASAPAGFRICNGAALSRTTFADLFTIIGTKYGTGDNVTTFNLPDLRARVPVGLAAGNFVHGTLGQTEGIASSTTRTSYHQHTHQHTHDNFSNVDVTPPLSTVAIAQGTGVQVTVARGDHIHQINQDTLGTSDTTTDTASPSYQVVNYIIKT